MQLMNCFLCHYILEMDDKATNDNRVDPIVAVPPLAEKALQMILSMDG